LILKNVDETELVSQILGELHQLVNTNLPGIVVEHESGATQAKNELILGLMLAIPTGIASSAIYDLLKLAIARRANAASPDANITINNVTVSLREIVSNPAVAQYFDDDHEEH